MTTKVTIDPANHQIEVKITEGAPDDNTTTTETIALNSPPREYWLYGTRVMTIREVGAPGSQP